jgi:tetratricopeptide (TPR) repeat protein
MTTPARFILLVIGLVIAAGVFMMPRRDEWLAVMQDEDQQSQVIALVEDRLSRGEDDPDLLATLGRSYAAIGNNPRAIERLEAYTQRRPRDAQAFAFLADLYGRIGDKPRQVALLERHIAITPTPSRVAELAELYDKDRQTAKELALLSRYEAEVGGESGMALRLAELLEARGDRSRAIQVLLRAEAAPLSKQPSQDGRERLALARMLVEAGRSQEAVRLGMQWIRQWNSAWLANRLLNAVLPRAPVADASALAEAVALAHPEIRFFLAHNLAEGGARPVARHVLATWIVAVRDPSPDEIAAFVSACRDFGAPELLWQAFGKALEKPASGTTLIRLSEAIAGEFGIGALAPFWSHLPAAALERQSLLAARLAFHEGNVAAARWLLWQFDLEGATSADRQMWFDLLVAVAQPAEAMDLLTARMGGRALPAELLPRLASLAGQL